MEDYRTCYLGKPLSPDQINICPKCNGTGLNIRGERCPKCYGTGHWKKGGE